MTEETAIATRTSTTGVEFSVGDHIFRWCSYMGVPFAYQQHAIVVAVRKPSEKEDEDDDDDGMILIMNFDHEDEQQNQGGNKLSENATGTQENKQEQNGDGSNGIAENGGDQAKEDSTTNEESIRDVDGDKEEDTTTTTTTPDSPCCKITQQELTLKQAQSQWEHVQYGHHWQKRLLLRAGTCSAATTDPVHVVLCRIAFLMHPDFGPQTIDNLPYHHHKANGECIAVWCMTGLYQSAQGMAKMGEAGMHVGSFSLVGSIAAQLAVSAVVPVILPFVAAMDVGQAVYSAKEVHATRGEWQARTVEWNQLFEKYIVQQGFVSRQNMDASSQSQSSQFSSSSSQKQQEQHS